MHVLLRDTQPDESDEKLTDIWYWLLERPTSCTKDVDWLSKVCNECVWTWVCIIFADKCVVGVSCVSLTASSSSVL